MSDFNVQVDGGAELVGPFVRDLDCTLGLVCSAVLSGYRGRSTNSLVIISNGTCGDADAKVANETWGPANATTLTYNGNDSNSTFDFGMPLVGLAGPSYRACWAHDPVGLKDYRVEIDGNAELVGTFVREFECTLGLPCTVLLSGYRMSSWNRMVAVSQGACG